MTDIFVKKENIEEELVEILSNTNEISQSKYNEDEVEALLGIEKLKTYEPPHQLRPSTFRRYADQYQFKNRINRSRNRTSQNQKMRKSSSNSLPKIAKRRLIEKEFLGIVTQTPQYILCEKHMNNVSIDMEKLNCHVENIQKWSDIPQQLDLNQTTLLHTSKRNSQNSIQNDEYSEEDVKKIEIVDNLQVACCVCLKNEKKSYCFSYGEGLICIKCAVRHCREYKDLQDWYHKDEVNEKMRRCDRLCHMRPLYHFLKLEKKNGQYKVGKLCLYCRNVKRWEYLQSQRYTPKKKSP